MRAAWFLALLVGAALNLDRRAFAQSGLGRPLVTGAILSLILRRPEGLCLGLWAELLWLWRLPVGGDYVPNGGLATSASLLGYSLAASHLGLAAPLARPYLALTFALLPLLAHLAIPVDKIGRRLAHRAVLSLASELENDQSPNIACYNLRGLPQAFGLGALFLFLASLLAAASLVALTLLVSQEAFWAPLSPLAAYAPTIALLAVSASLARPSYFPFALGLLGGLLFVCGQRLWGA
ncbi:MAG: hypothetical protein LBO66_02200 [Deltaproteobacteria bacterium]|jgi:mannose/fructose/N-acetylgalactosamine-specific phosphotransferase system component IIC|nr:hypothetical protein [Deltaproteobacteria bacterium]